MTGSIDLRPERATTLRVAALAVLGFLPGLLAGAAERDVCPGLRFAEATTEYGHGVLGHGVLGDGGEWKSIAGPGVVPLRLGSGRVFEDLAIRCADLDGTGQSEIVVVESGAEKGAQLAIYAVETCEGSDAVSLRKVAATPAIGTRHRWLAPAGIGDIDGDGEPEIAIVAMPHLEGRLEVWGLAPGGLMREATGETAVSNHRIGEEVLTAALRSCEGEPATLVLPRFDWSELVALTIAGGRLEARPVAGDADAATVDRLADCARPLPGGGG